jgi:putative flavoprotein involved in K+ transport
MDEIMKAVEVLVIGAGQTGLAMGYHLKKSGFNFLLVDGGTRIGDSWRKRYDSLLLFTPRALSTLPGLTMPGDQQGYANRDEFADYLEIYASHYDFPIVMNAEITRLEHLNGHYCATTRDGRKFLSKAVVLANGGFQKPIIPDTAQKLSKTVVQFSAANYRNPSQIPAETVVVVGDGATGRDIAAELSATHTVFLSTGRPRRLMPEKILGISMWWWLGKFGLLTVSGESFIGRKMREVDPFPNRNRELSALRHMGIQILPKMTGAEAGGLSFQNGTSIAPQTVIWAVGYRDDTDWVAIPEVKDAQGNFLHEQGIAPVRNLYFVGRPWQTSRASALIYGAGRDAELIMETILREVT